VSAINKHKTSEVWETANNAFGEYVLHWSKPSSLLIEPNRSRDFKTEEIFPNGVF
jgi:hypothetical protein